MSGEIVEESSRPLLSQRLSRSPLGAKENSAAIRLFINSQTCVEICRRVVVVLCSLKDYLVGLWVLRSTIRE